MKNSNLKFTMYCNLSRSYALSLFFISFSSTVFSNSDCNSMYWIQVKTEPPLPCIQSPFHTLLSFSYIISLHNDLDALQDHCMYNNVEKKYSIWL